MEQIKEARGKMKYAIFTLISFSLLLLSPLQISSIDLLSLDNNTPTYSSHEPTINHLGENWSVRLGLDDHQLPYSIHHVSNGGFYIIHSNTSTSTTDNHCNFSFCGNPILRFFDENGTLEWTIDLNEWGIKSSETDGENITIAMHPGLISSMRFNPSSLTSDRSPNDLMIVSFMQNGTMNWWNQILMGEVSSGNTESSSQRPADVSVTSDGGVFFSGVIGGSGQIDLNNTMTLTGQLRSLETTSVSAPWWRCINPYSVDSLWWAKLGSDGNWDFSYVSSSKSDDKYGGSVVDQLNNSITIIAELNQDNNNCNSGSTSWSIAGGTATESNAFHAKFDFNGTGLGLSTISYSISDLATIDNWVYADNNQLMALWEDSFTWNASVDSSSDLVVTIFNATTLKAMRGFGSELTSLSIHNDPYFGLEFTACLEGSFSVNGSLISIDERKRYLGTFDANLNITSLMVISDCILKGPVDRYSINSLTIAFSVESIQQFNHLSSTGPSYNESDIVIMSYSYDDDGDMMADHIDPFPIESTQWSDQDQDSYGDNPAGFQFDECVTLYGTSFRDRFGCNDIDNDGQSDIADAFPIIPSQWQDSDYDGYGDNQSGFRGDSCIDTYGQSTVDRFGCEDEDGDGRSDLNDEMMDNITQWSDEDGDGFGDNPVGVAPDACVKSFGNSTIDRYGCLDNDGDGWSDQGDDLPLEPTQYSDLDGDGYGDNQSENASQVDIFPSDGTQWNDTDGDGHGDNKYGSAGDHFPVDQERWADQDEDGVADVDDVFVSDSTQSDDRDGDGFGDDVLGRRGDACPDDPGNSSIDRFGCPDTDADGVSDEEDAFPSDPTKWKDTDNDGLADEDDAFPFDPSQQNDSDGDGFGDNPLGTSSDKFPDDSSQWSDIDGDGYGDNRTGDNSDAFITDATQWSDSDGDGYGDNPTGRQADLFKNDSTQWEDDDGDGLGDNPNGNDPDPYLNDFDNDGFNDSIDILPKLASPGDLDADGCLDEVDEFPANPQECSDNDGDGEGDNADFDDDNDGWADTDEIRLGTDPLDGTKEPVDSFEIVIPGTSVGLGAWDLIGMFGGIPLFCWIGFGFITRNGRSAKYESMLREADTRDELEGVAHRWEYSLMLRLLGPHQGIRLERLRAELDDRFEGMNQKLTSIEGNQNDQTHLVIDEMVESEKMLPTLGSEKPSLETIGLEDGKGYEWFTDSNETQWYRVTGSNSEWDIFKS